MNKKLLTILMLSLLSILTLSSCRNTQNEEPTPSVETATCTEICENEDLTEEPPDKGISEILESSADQTNNGNKNVISKPQNKNEVPKPQVEACKHNFVLISEEPASCTSEGVQFYSCTVCGANQQNSIPAYGHNFVEISHSDSTCTNAGTHTLSCSNCGSTYSEQTSSPLGHVFGGWNISDSEHFHTCSRCGVTEFEAHNWKDDVCTVCGVVDFR